MGELKTSIARTGRFWDSVKIIWSYCMRFTIVHPTLLLISSSHMNNMKPKIGGHHEQNDWPLLVVGCCVAAVYCYLKLGFLRRSKNSWWVAYAYEEPLVPLTWEKLSMHFGWLVDDVTRPWNVVSGSGESVLVMSKKNNIAKIMI